MYITTSIQEKVLETPEVRKMATVFDAVIDFKQENMSLAMRTHNDALVLSPNWMLKKLTDYGLDDMPRDYPLRNIQQLLLNINTYFSLRGSKIGMDFVCSILTFGKTSLDDTDFYEGSDDLLYDDKKQGYYTESTGFFSDKMYVAKNSSGGSGGNSASISISSPYFNPSSEWYVYSEIVQQYVLKTVPKFTPANPNSAVDVVFLSGDTFYYHPLLNQYFKPTLIS